MNHDAGNDGPDHVACGAQADYGVFRKPSVPTSAPTSSA
jgi:hypothetical protein